MWGGVSDQRECYTGDDADVIRNAERGYRSSLESEVQTVIARRRRRRYQVWTSKAPVAQLDRAAAF
jgi:hypothetical protein